MTRRPSLRAIAILATVVVSGIGCGDDSGGSTADGGPGSDGGGPRADGGAVMPDPTAFTYRLEESRGDLALWTTPVTHKVEADERAPSETRSGLGISAARREFEPAQLIVGPGAGTLRVEVAPFPALGSSQRIEVARAVYEGAIAEHLEPVGSADHVTLLDDRGVPLWITVRVPDDAPAGDHETTVSLTPSSGATVEVPLHLYVFDFALPEEVHFASQLNIGISGLSDALGGVDEAKTMLFEHRFTPKSVTWPSGFNWGITWENGRSTDPCGTFWDEPDEGAAFSIGSLARRYILGEGWNGVGFPNAMIFQFVDNATPRPTDFCGIARGDHFGSDAYNAEWSEFLGALDGYLMSNGYSERAYYYVQNEPQDDADHQLAAHLCRLTKAAAPNLRIAISDEPKPEIAEDAGGACGYDIWIAHIRAYQEAYAWERQRDHGETVWFYSLDHDPEPYPNPTVVDRQGMNQRVLPWIAWIHRIRGWAYYDFGRFFDGGRPSIRAELFREGFEDYEYLYLANGGAHPVVFEDGLLDPTVRGVASSVTSWLRDPDALMALRHELGRFIEGSRSDPPVLVVDDPRPRGPSFVNFQDPGGRPNADPLSVGGDEYLKVGWEAWDEARGWGWFGENIGDPAIALHGFDDLGGFDVLEQSYVYDDYGRRNLFELAVASGRYDVTIGVGRPGRGYPGDPHNATVEGVVVVDDEVTTDAAPTIARTVTVDVNDGRLSVEVGGRSASTGDFAYTFLAYLRVLPAD